MLITFRPSKNYEPFFFSFDPGPYRIVISFPNWLHLHKVLLPIHQAKLSLLYHILFLEAPLFSVEEIIHQTQRVRIFVREGWGEIWDVNSALPTAFVSQQQGKKKRFIKMYCSSGKGIGSRYRYLKKKNKNTVIAIFVTVCSCVFLPK